MYCFGGAARRVATSQFAKSLFSRLRRQKRVYPPLCPPTPPRFLSRFALFSCHFWVRFFVRKLDPWSPPGLVHAYLYIFRRFFGHQKRIFWKQSPWWRVFENARLWFKGEPFSSPVPLGLICNRPGNDGLRGREWIWANENMLMSFIIQRMLCEGRNRIFIVLGFSCGWAKTMLRYMWRRIFFFENEEKVSVFKKLISRCCVDKRRRINISLESSFFQIAMTWNTSAFAGFVNDA